jgi:hypothetical protein
MDTDRKACYSVLFKAPKGGGGVFYRGGKDGHPAVLGACGAENWLPPRDSNPDRASQSRLSYH